MIIIATVHVVQKFINIIAFCNDPVPLTWPGNFQLKLTSTSGSPNTVQVMLKVSPAIMLSAEASRLAKGGPLGTGNTRREDIVYNMMEIPVIMIRNISIWSYYYLRHKAACT